MSTKFISETKFRAWLKSLGPRRKPCKGDQCPIDAAMGTESMVGRLEWWSTEERMAEELPMWARCFIEIADSDRYGPWDELTGDALRAIYAESRAR